MSNAYILNKECQEFAAREIDKKKKEHALALCYYPVLLGSKIITDLNCVSLLRETFSCEGVKNYLIQVFFPLYYSFHYKMCYQDSKLLLYSITQTFDTSISFTVTG